VCALQRAWGWQTQQHTREFDVDIHSSLSQKYQKHAFHPCSPTEEIDLNNSLQYVRHMPTSNLIMLITKSNTILPLKKLLIFSKVALGKKIPNCILSIGSTRKCKYRISQCDLSNGLLLCNNETLLLGVPISKSGRRAKVVICCTQVVHSNNNII
jgi:hypothetical protein